jgi:pantothenate kinase type III
MILLFDIGNTNTHVGLADDRRVVRHTDIPTADWRAGRARAQLARFVGKANVNGAAICSVVPRVTPVVRKQVRQLWKLAVLELTPKTPRVGIDYPNRYDSPDRLANAMAARGRFGAPRLCRDSARQ